MSKAVLISVMLCRPLRMQVILSTGCSLFVVIQSRNEQHPKLPLAFLVHGYIAGDEFIARLIQGLITIWFSALPSHPDLTAGTSRQSFAPIGM